jgi:hypothetical protein
MANSLKKKLKKLAAMHHAFAAVEESTRSAAEHLRLKIEKGLRKRVRMH